MMGSRRRIGAALGGLAILLLVAGVAVGFLLPEPDCDAARNVIRCQDAAYGRREIQVLALWGVGIAAGLGASGIILADRMGSGKSGAGEKPRTPATRQPSSPSRMGGTGMQQRSAGPPPRAPSGRAPGPPAPPWPPRK